MVALIPQQSLHSVDLSETFLIATSQCMVDINVLLIVTCGPRISLAAAEIGVTQLVGPENGKRKTKISQQSRDFTWWRVGLLCFCVFLFSDLLIY